MSLNRGIGADTRTRRALAGMTGGGSAGRGARTARFKGGIEVYECGATGLSLYDDYSGTNSFFYVYRSPNSPRTLVLHLGDTYADPLVRIESTLGGRMYVGRPLFLKDSASTYPVSQSGEVSLNPIVTSSETKLQAELWWDTGSVAVTRALAYSDRLLPKIMSSATGSPHTATLHENIILADATSAALTIALPAAAGAEGHEYVIKKIDASANAVTVDGDGAETIDGAATVALAAQYDKVRIVASNGAWYIV